jgi:maleylpyruvate isomerase
VPQHGAGSSVIEGACGERLRETLPWLDRGTEFFLAQLASLRDDELSLPSALPGWSRLHVVSHMARNARALMNLLHWAETGVESPMYPSPEHRRDDIEAGARLPPAEVRADAIGEADRLAAALGAMPDGAWGHEVRTALGRPVMACEVPWMRVREVWVHGVDLGAGASFADIDPDVARALFDEAVDRLADREDCPPVTLVVEGSPAERRALGPATEGRPVASGSPRALAGWLLGRTGGTGVDCTSTLPELPAWL